MIDKEVIARATIYSATLLQFRTRSLQVCCSNLSKHIETQNQEPHTLLL
jgi:hypothetical protein